MDKHDDGSNRRNPQRYAIVLGALLIVGLSTSWPVDAQTSGALQGNYAGTLDRAKVGLTLVMEGDRVSRGHYFYYRYLKDIPLTGLKSGSNLTLREANGTFNLHFVDGTAAGKPLDMAHSTALDGTWTDGKKTLPVRLEGGGGASVAQPGHWYAQITDQPDDIFEARAQGFYFAALKGDSAEAARYVDFPLRVNWSDTQYEIVKTPAQLAKEWKRIFTPDYLAALRAEAPHNMTIVKSEYAMLGSGLAFFSDKGVSVINTVK